MTTNPDRILALCCCCGTLRTVSANFNRRLDMNQSADDDRHPRGWRMTATLKCSQCASQTRHALLRDDKPDHRDYAEQRQNGLALSNSELIDRPRELLYSLTPADLTKSELRHMISFLSIIAARVRPEDAGR